MISAGPMHASRQEYWSILERYSIAINETLVAIVGIRRNKKWYIIEIDKNPGNRP